MVSTYTNYTMPLSTGTIAIIIAIGALTISWVRPRMETDRKIAADRKLREDIERKKVAYRWYVDFLNNPDDINIIKQLVTVFQDDVCIHHHGMALLDPKFHFTNIGKENFTLTEKIIKEHRIPILKQLLYLSGTNWPSVVVEDTLLKNGNNWQ